MKAKVVQELFGVQDRDIICHGYTFDRETLDIWFEEGRLVRCMTDSEGTVLNLRNKEDFDPLYFTENVKRWYSATVNERLREFWAAFNGSFNETPGGYKPSCPPIKLHKWVEDL